MNPKKSRELITNDIPSDLESCKSLLQTTGAADKQDPTLRAFLRSIEVFSRGSSFGEISHSPH